VAEKVVSMVTHDNVQDADAVCLSFVNHCLIGNAVFTGWLCDIMVIQPQHD